MHRVHPHPHVQLGTSALVTAGAASLTEIYEACGSVADTSGVGGMQQRFNQNTELLSSMFVSNKAAVMV